MPTARSLLCHCEATIVAVAIFILFAFPAYAVETSGEGPLDTVGAKCTEEQIFTNGTYECTGIYQSEENKTVCQYNTETDCIKNFVSTKCRYGEEKADGQYSCIGTLQTDEDSGETVCQFNEAVEPKCEKGTPPIKPQTIDPTLCNNPKGCQITNSNFTAPQASDYAFSNIMKTLLFNLTGAKPGGTPGVVDVIENGKVVPKIIQQDPNGGATGFMTSVMVAMYSSPPTSTAHYLANLRQNLGFAEPAYAQVSGSGAGIIKPVEMLWRVTRNLAYIAFILVFVAVGFMIMFRARINPQTVISAQAALPGLVIGLILVTFSYFVAALIVDLSFVSIQVVGQIFLQVKDPNGKVMNTLDVDALRTSSNAFNLFVSTARVPENVGDVTGGVFRTFSSVFGGGVGGGTGAVLAPAVIGAIIGTLIAPGLGTAVGAIVGASAPVIIGLIVPLILIIALIIQFFRLLFQLISSYIAILVTTVAGPFIILASSIPGRGGALSLWWKSLLGNSLVFPAVFAAFLFAGMILWTPLEFWNASPPLFGGLSTELLRLIIAYGLILGTPAIPGMVKKAIGVPDIQGIPQEATTGALASFGLTRGVATGGYQNYWRGSGTKPGSAPVGPLAKGYQAARARFTWLPKLVKTP